MYDYSQIDRNIINQQWFIDMEFVHTAFFMWTWIFMDSIGIYDINLYKFSTDCTRGFVSPSDIDIEQFVQDCNNDGKERMRLIDNGKRLWFTPTLIFKNGNKAGYRKLNTSDRDAAIVNVLAQRKVTREWTIEEIKKKDRLTIDTKLIKKVILYSVENPTTRKFAYHLAKAVGYEVPEFKELPEKIKADYGHICQYCGGLFDDFDLQIDHIIPTSKNGPNKWINKIPACIECNQKKSNKNVFLFMKEMGFEWRTGLKDRVDNLIKKGLLDYPRDYPFKKRNKKRFFKHSEVIHIHSDSRDKRTMKDFERTKEFGTNGKKLWIQKD